MVGLDIPIPASCGKCKFKSAKWCYLNITIADKFDSEKEVPEQGRPSWCPMVDLNDDLK